MNINEIQDLIKFVAKAGVNEVEIEKKDFKIVIKSDYMDKKKTNFKEEPTIVQQQIPVGNIPAQAVAAALSVEASRLQRVRTHAAGTSRSGCWPARGSRRSRWRKRRGRPPRRRTARRR